MITLYKGNSLNYIETLDHPVDVIITDPPYGVTQHKADQAVDLAPFFSLCKGLVIFSQQPFTSELVVKHRKHFKYEVIWDKILVSGFLNANRRPLRRHENILVFGKPVYNPQKTVGKKNHSMGKKKDHANHNYGTYDFIDNSETLGDLKHPTTLVTYSKPHPSIALHRTEKPVELMEYLVATYSNPGDTVFDPFMGAGATGVACIRLGRSFIGCELDEHYFDLAGNRIDQELRKCTSRIQN